jgi:proline dehydrogenase
MLRAALLALSRSQRMRAFASHNHWAWAAAGRFVAGETIDEAIQVCHELNNRRMRITLDHLGENVSTEQEARAAQRSYLEALKRLYEADINGGISLKLTALGLDISTELASDLLHGVIEGATNVGRFVRIDMEGSHYTQRTLDIFFAAFRRYDNVGAVIQSYLYRSEKDVRRLIDVGAGVRLVKGAYREPSSIAFPHKRDVDRNFIRLAELLLSPQACDRGVYTAIATHDPDIIDWTLEHTSRTSIPADRWEFQMLYGIRRDLQQSLSQAGHRMRVYVPYGREWYPYFMRRMAERPANVGFVVRNLARELVSG